MTGLELAAAVLLAVAALVAAVRYLRSGARMRYLLAALQPVAAVLLYFALFAPAPRADAELVVLTAGATPEQLRAVQSARAPYVALPEAPAATDATRAADLAHALRAHRGTTRVRVLGAGLAARDLDAARGLVLRFDPAPAPRGIVALSGDASVAAGRELRVAGRVAGVAGGTVELRDPGDAVVATRPLDAAGDFAFAARAAQPGPALFRVRVLDPRGAEVESLAVPVAVRASTPLRVGVLGGGIGPELKYLRRYLADAGFELRSRLG
ncbi:MAG TPA: carboxypeptidase regulatory-like domain-containing protein, partial [Xanthomonadales bacterium]|nr:carboxypeptidase regulatory-like domain-containing protein [Xanthomonadales bacterium]